MYLDIALLLAIAPGILCYGNIFEFMSPDEVQHVFHANADSVPQFEVVNLNFHERLQKRGLPSSNRLHLIAFGENINLWIHPKDSIFAGVNTPVWYAKSSPSATEGVEYTRQHGLMETVGQIFEDPNKMASLVIGTEDDGRTRVNGHIGSNGIAIRSLPRRVADEYSRRRRSVDIADGQNSSYHVVIKIDEAFADNHIFSLVNETRIRERLSRSAAIPSIVYPEILVVVENTLYKAFNSSQVQDLLEYLLAFWNGVDLKYRSLESPKFRLNIAGIVLSQDVNATPYIARHNVTDHGFNCDLAIEDANSFYYAVSETFPFDSYDAVFTMTSLIFGEDGDYTCGIAGVETICTIEDELKMKNSTALIRDNGVFSGISPGAHELGHLLGAEHDENNIDCNSINGNIMAYSIRQTNKSSDFSPCSIAQFQSMLDNGTMACVYNLPPNPGRNLPKLMPGRVKTLKEQCNALGFGDPCKDSAVTHSICAGFLCMGRNGCRLAIKAAVDGTPCEGENKFCLHEQCVSL